jgi:PHD/YefM family antitoxin component YafN of YafNO toxin-antitoxin module
VTASQSAKVEKRSPEIVLRDGQPAAVILDIDEYQDMLERLEDLDDLEMLKQGLKVVASSPARRMIGGFGSEIIESSTRSMRPKKP